MYIGVIIDQSNWSGPFSLVVMTPDLESSNLGLHPGQGTRLEVFIYRSISPPTILGQTQQQQSKNIYIYI